MQILPLPPMEGTLLHFSDLKDSIVMILMEICNGKKILDYSSQSFSRLEQLNGNLQVLRSFTVVFSLYSVMYWKTLLLPHMILKQEKSYGKLREMNTRGGVLPI